MLSPVRETGHLSCSSYTSGSVLRLSTERVGSSLIQSGVVFQFLGLHQLFSLCNLADREPRAALPALAGSPSLAV